MKITSGLRKSLKMLQRTCSHATRGDRRIDDHRARHGSVSCSGSVHRALCGRQEHRIKHVMHRRRHAVCASNAHDGTGLRFEL